MMTPKERESCQKFFNWFAEKQEAKMLSLCLSHVMYGDVTCAGLGYTHEEPTKDAILTSGINKSMRIF